MKYRLNYIINVWLTSAVLGVVLLGACQYISFIDVPTQPLNIVSSVHFFGLVILLSSFITLPVALCLLGYLTFLIKKSLTYKTIKQLLAIASFALCTLTLAILSVFFREHIMFTLLMISCYAIPLVASIFFYRVR